MRKPWLVYGSDLLLLILIALVIKEAFSLIRNDIGRMKGQIVECEPTQMPPNGFSVEQEKASGVTPDIAQRPTIQCDSAHAYLADLRIWIIVIFVTIFVRIYAQGGLSIFNWNKSL